MFNLYDVTIIDSGYNFKIVQVLSLSERERNAHCRNKIH